MTAISSKGKLKKAISIIHSPRYKELGHFKLLFCRGRLTNVQRFIEHMHSHSSFVFRRHHCCCHCGLPMSSLTVNVEKQPTQGCDANLTNSKTTNHQSYKITEAAKQNKFNKSTSSFSCCFCCCRCPFFSSFIFSIHTYYIFGVGFKVAQESCLFLSDFLHLSRHTSCVFVNNYISKD